MSDIEDENIVICYMCGVAEDKKSRIIECVQCNRSVHFKCKKIMGNAVTKARKKDFFCTTDCIDMHQRAIVGHSGMNEFVTKLSEVSLFMQEAKLESTHVRAELQQTRGEIGAMMSTAQSIEASQVFISKEFENMKAMLLELKEKICDLNKENTELKNEVGQWREKYEHLAGKVDQLELDLDKMNRSSLAQNAVIMGLPNTPNEDAKHLVLDVCAALQYEIDGTAIVSARRLSGKNNSSEAAPILVSFNSVDVKNGLLEKKQTFGTLQASAVNIAFAASKKKVTLREEMTNFGRELLREVKEMQAELNIKYVWPGRNGKILIRRVEGAKVEQIGTKLELQSLGKTVYKRMLNTSTRSSFEMASPSSQPSPKRSNNN